MKVGEIMTRGVEIASPDDTVQQAASRMVELDVGVLPVGENDRLVGIPIGTSRSALWPRAGARTRRCARR
jgi:predicted transcriptional regulator